MVVESVDCTKVVVSVPLWPLCRSDRGRGRKGGCSAPAGQDGLSNTQVCTISFPGVRERYLPLTPPPKREYSVSGCAAD